MPYDVAVVRPESDAPVSKLENWMQWFSWAKKNQPSASVLTTELSDFLRHLRDADPMTWGVDEAGEALTGIEFGQDYAVTPRLAAGLADNPFVRPPEQIYRVLKFAALNGYPVRFTATVGDAIADH